MNLPEHILDEAIQRLRDGEDAFSIARDYGIYAEELQELLLIAESAMHLPKLPVPTPHKQYRFAEVRTMPYFFGEFLNTMRIAVIPIALVVVMLGGRFVVQAAEDSIPGDTLYTLKRASETARLGLTVNPQKEANLHMELTQKRLDEVKKAIVVNNPTAEAAAIVALKEQSEKTFATVPQVAVANALTNKDQNLLNDLVAINKEQKDVLTAIGENDENQPEANTALIATKENDKTLAKLIATVYEQTLVDLPNKISVTGDIISLTASRITVEKTTFIINNTTSVSSIDGLKLEDFTKLTGRVTVIGTQSDNGLIAKQISMIAVEEKPTATEPEGEVKGTTTTTPTPTQEPASEPTTEPAEPTNQATGTFITEPSDAQYTP